MKAELLSEYSEQQINDYILDMQCKKFVQMHKNRLSVILMNAVIDGRNVDILLESYIKRESRSPQMTVAIIKPYFQDLIKEVKDKSKKYLEA